MSVCYEIFHIFLCTDMFYFHLQKLLDKKVIQMCAYHWDKFNSNAFYNMKKRNYQ